MGGFYFWAVPQDRQSAVEIRRKLFQPLGSNIAIDRIGPSEQIPFMIVFVHDPPGVDKVTVMVAGEERLLQ